jgi:hypothetical protein
MRAVETQSISAQELAEIRVLLDRIEGKKP